MHLHRNICCLEMVILQYVFESVFQEREPLEISRQFFKPLPSNNNLKVVSARVTGAVISHTKGPPNYDLAYNHLLKHMYI